MEQLSVSIITFNEEKNIGRCLESVLSLADEIVVLDSFSDDRTREICAKYPVKFYTHAFDGYIEQKNRALSYCNHRYVLSLDADEALSEGLQRAIASQKKAGFTGAYRFNRLTNYCGHWVKHCGWYPDVKIRLFNRENAFWGGLNPHDRIEFNRNEKITHLSGDLHHYSYYSLEDHYRQVEHFSTIGARAYYEQGRKAGWLNLMFSPVAKFIRDYFFNLGFLDGKAGWQICVLSASATFHKYRKLRALWKAKKR